QTLSEWGDGAVSSRQPVLTIKKPPDAGTFHAGDTISFTSVVTNLGPETATNVRFNPVDTLPDPNSSLTWFLSSRPAQGSCTVSAAPPRPQTLSCTFGDMAQGASLTVTVSSATQKTDTGDCGSPSLRLDNSATAGADK